MDQATLAAIERNDGQRDGIWRDRRACDCRTPVGVNVHVPCPDRAFEKSRFAAISSFRANEALFFQAASPLALGA